MKVKLVFGKKKGFLKIVW